MKRIAPGDKSAPAAKHLRPTHIVVPKATLVWQDKSKSIDKTATVDFAASNIRTIDDLKAHLQRMWNLATCNLMGNATSILTHPSRGSEVPTLRIIATALELKEQMRQREAGSVADDDDEEEGLDQMLTVQRLECEALGKTIARGCEEEARKFRRHNPTSRATLSEICSPEWFNHLAFHSQVDEIIRLGLRYPNCSSGVYWCAAQCAIVNNKMLALETCIEVSSLGYIHKNLASLDNGTKMQLLDKARQDLGTQFRLQVPWRSLYTLVSLAYEFGRVPMLDYLHRRLAPSEIDPADTRKWPDHLYTLRLNETEPASNNFQFHLGNAFGPSRSTKAAHFHLPAAKWLIRHGAQFGWGALVCAIRQCLDEHGPWPKKRLAWCWSMTKQVSQNWDWIGAVRALTQSSRLPCEMLTQVWDCIPESLRVPCANELLTQGIGSGRIDWIDLACGKWGADIRASNDVHLLAACARGRLSVIQQVIQTQLNRIKMDCGEPNMSDIRALVKLFAPPPEMAAGSSSSSAPKTVDWFGLSIDKRSGMSLDDDKGQDSSKDSSFALTADLFAKPQIERMNAAVASCWDTLGRSSWDMEAEQIREEELQLAASAGYLLIQQHFYVVLDMTQMKRLLGSSAMERLNQAIDTIENAEKMNQAFKRGPFMQGLSATLGLAMDVMMVIASYLVELGLDGNVSERCKHARAKLPAAVVVMQEEEEEEE